MILDVFEYNQHFVAMMNIINSSRLNPPESGHKHHIIPKCWYRMNNIPIDNSEANLVLLSYEDHVKVHKLTILCAKDSTFKGKMGYAVHRLLKGNFKGMHHTEETRKKMSEAHKGHPSTLKGVTLSDDTRRKMSEAHKGKIGEKSGMYGHTHSIESRRKISEAMKGRTFSEESRRKMSESKKGKQGTWKGKHHSEETRKKMSESQKGKKRGPYKKRG